MKNLNLAFFSRMPVAEAAGLWILCARLFGVEFSLDGAKTALDEAKSW